MTGVLSKKRRKNANLLHGFFRGMGIPMKICYKQVSILLKESGMSVFDNVLNLWIDADILFCEGRLPNAINLRGEKSKGRCGLYSLTNKTYGLDDKTYGLDDKTYGLSDKTYGLSNKTYGLSDKTYGLSDKTYGLSNKTYGLDNKTYGLYCHFRCFPLRHLDYAKLKVRRLPCK
jgi:hypothetical protein